MKHYDFAKHFLALHAQAVSRFASGKRGVETFFTPDELAFLKANGMTAQHLYDYAEDANNYGEPDAGTALAIESIRRDYFFNVQGGKPSTTVLDVATMPAKTAALKGITWLPRILPKARAKLRGELPPALMYGCGGDRAFFQQHNIYPPEFLALIWRTGNDDNAVAEWVAARSGAK